MASARIACKSTSLEWMRPRPKIQDPSIDRAGDSGSARVNMNPNDPTILAQRTGIESLDAVEVAASRTNPCFGQELVRVLREALR